MGIFGCLLVFDTAFLCRIVMVVKVLRKILRGFLYIQYSTNYFLTNTYVRKDCSFLIL